MVCANSPHGAPERHEIPDGARCVEIRPMLVNWGDDDIRADWEGSYVFCSFGCLAEWAAAKAAEHDQHVLKEGTG